MAQISVDSLIGNSGPSYPEQIAAPYRKELTDNGFTQMLTIEDVDNALKVTDGKIKLVVLNSVCGCGARVARPGALLSLFSKVVPDERFTLFAGMEKDAVAHFRNNYLQGITPSSPNIYLYKDGELIFILHRYQIERSAAGDIADALIQEFEKVCTKQNDDASVEELRQYFINTYDVDPLSVEQQQQ
ncbi:MAG TPA: BrxA/BrxB family bacilliredoxin [Parafilimonas sp.]|jgi:putative YphP/YqiW family bacilliredoxin